MRARELLSTNLWVKKLTVEREVADLVSANTEEVSVAFALGYLMGGGFCVLLDSVSEDGTTVRIYPEGKGGAYRPYGCAMKVTAECEQQALYTIYRYHRYLCFGSTKSVMSTRECAVQVHINHQ